MDECMWGLVYIWDVSLPYCSGISGSFLSSGFSLCAVQYTYAYVAFLWISRVSQREHASRWISYNTSPYRRNWVCEWCVFSPYAQSFWDELHVHRDPDQYRAFPGGEWVFMSFFMSCCPWCWNTSVGAVAISSVVMMVFGERCNVPGFISRLILITNVS